MCIFDGYGLIVNVGYDKNRAFYLTETLRHVKCEAGSRSDLSFCLLFSVTEYRKCQ